MVANILETFFAINNRKLTAGASFTELRRSPILLLAGLLATRTRREAWLFRKSRASPVSFRPQAALPGPTRCEKARPAVASRRVPLRKRGCPGCRCAGRADQNRGHVGWLRQYASAPSRPITSTRSRPHPPRPRRVPARSPTGRLPPASRCADPARVRSGGLGGGRTGRPIRTSPGAIAEPNLRQPLLRLEGMSQGDRPASCVGFGAGPRTAGQDAALSAVDQESSTPAARSNSPQRSTAYPLPNAFRLISTPRRRNRIVCRSSSSSSQR